MSDAKIILDTNIVSCLMKGHWLAETYVPLVQDQLLSIAFITSRRDVLWCGEGKLGCQKAF